MSSAHHPHIIHNIVCGEILGWKLPADDICYPHVIHMLSAHHPHGQKPGKKLPKVKEIRLISWIGHLFLRLQRGKTCFPWQMTSHLHIICMSSTDAWQMTCHLHTQCRPSIHVTSLTDNIQRNIKVIINTN